MTLKNIIKLKKSNEKSATGNKQIILLVTSFPFPHFGGLASGLIYEASYFANKGHNVFILSLQGENIMEPRLIHKNIHLIPLNFIKPRSIFRGFVYKLLLSIRYTFIITSLISKGNLKFVHAHDLYAALACFLAGIRNISILHLHSVASLDRFIMEDYSHLPISWKLLSLLDFLVDFILELIIYNSVKSILCVSEYEWSDALRKVINKNKVALLRNGIDTAIFRPKQEIRKKLRSEMNIKDDTVVCMFLGRMVPKNGPLLIAEALSILKGNKKLFFIFVGNGVQKKYVIDSVKKNNVSNVLFLNEQPAKNILPVADIFISHVSSNVEGYGQTILEAMASGIPTITGRDKIKENVFKEDEILLINKDNPEEIAKAVSTLYSDENRRIKLSLNGMNKVKSDLSLQKSIEFLENLV